jgi:hypothetical protein
MAMGCWADFGSLHCALCKGAVSHQQREPNNGMCCICISCVSKKRSVPATKKDIQTPDGSNQNTHPSIRCQQTTTTSKQRGTRRARARPPPGFDPGNFFSPYGFSKQHCKMAVWGPKVDPNSALGYIGTPEYTNATKSNTTHFIAI